MVDMPKSEKARRSRSYWAPELRRLAPEGKEATIYYRRAEAYAKDANDIWLNRHNGNAAAAGRLLEGMIVLDAQKLDQQELDRASRTVADYLAASNAKTELEHAIRDYRSGLVQELFAERVFNKGMMLKMLDVREEYGRIIIRLGDSLSELQQRFPSWFKSTDLKRKIWDAKIKELVEVFYDITGINLADGQRRCNNHFDVHDEFKVDVPPNKSRAAAVKPLVRTDMT